MKLVVPKTKLILPTAVALVIIGVGTYVQGVLSDRWDKRRTEKLVGFTDRLAEVPMTIGDWDGTDQPFDEDQFKASNCDGQISREYRNHRNQKVVSVYLVSGTGRHVTIHTPDWCYRGAGYEMENSEHIGYSIPVEALDPDPEFRTATFAKPDELTGTSDRLRIFWTFTDDGNWQSPPSPKPAFGAREAMFKLYLITTAARRHESPEDSPALDFAEEFFPVINEILFREKESVEGDESLAPQADQSAA